MNMKWNVGKKIGIGFGLALLFLIVIGGVSLRCVIKLEDTSQWVTHTHAVIEKVESLFSALKDAETGQRGYIITGAPKYLEPYNTARDSLSSNLKELKALTKDNQNQQRRLDQLEALIMGSDGKLSELERTISLRRDKGFEIALAEVMTDKGKSTMDSIRKVIGEMELEETTLLKTRSEEAQAAARNALLIIVLGSLTAVIAMCIAGFLITRDISQPLQNLTRVSERIALGELENNVFAGERGDEVGILLRAFDRMTQWLRSMAGTAEQIAAGDLRSSIKPLSEKDVLGNSFARMIQNLQGQSRGLVEGAGQLSTAANEIMASTSQLSSSASQSSTSVSETTTTVEEVRQTAQVSSQKAKAVSDIAQRAAQFSQSGRKATEDASSGMVRIRQQMEAIATNMMQLSEQGQAVVLIVATVEDIAAQSNLLAVNAGIEAAKAGEHGRGFSVVAQEIKNLAEQSRMATNQVRTILNDIQKATTAAVLATEQGSKAVEAGEKQMGAAKESIQVLATSVVEASQAATQIAASSQQQLVGMDQVALAMESIKQASSQNVDSAQQLEIAARNLAELGRRLKQLVDYYKL